MNSYRAHASFLVEPFLARNDIGVDAQECQCNDQLIDADRTDRGIQRDAIDQALVESVHQY